MATATTPSTNSDRPMRDPMLDALVAAPAAQPRDPTEPLAAVPDRGRTVVSDDVITTIAEIAAQQVEGVHRLGTTGLRGMLGRIGSHPGVGSEVGMKQAAITFEIVADFGYRLDQIAHEVRRRVIGAVETMAHREVIAVDITFVDVYVAKPEQRTGRQLD